MPDEDKASQDELSKAVERERKRASVRSLDFSLNELADMYATGELHITPEYQRTFRWSQAKQSQFIESIILEMPVPPIYLVEAGEAKWELIDGLQRLSTYLHLRGQLKTKAIDSGSNAERPLNSGAAVAGENEGSEELEEADGGDQAREIEGAEPEMLRLFGCDILQELNGYTFPELTTTLQHRIRRATLRVELVRRESNPRFAYYMFKRLNMGGEPLSDQEARNCSIRLMNGNFINFVTRLSNFPPFKHCTEDVTEEARARMEESELVLRFFAFKNNLHEYVHDIEPFLTNFMERVTDVAAPNHIAFAYAEEEEIFRRTFETLSKTLGPQACRRYVGGRYSGGFSRSHYEAFSLGLAQVIQDIPPMGSPEVEHSIREALEAAKQDPDLKNLTTGGGKNFKRIYEKKIELVAKRLRDAV